MSKLQSKPSKKSVGAKGNNKSIVKEDGDMLEVDGKPSSRGKSADRSTKKKEKNNRNSM